MMLTDKSLWLTTTGALALGMLAPAALAQDAALAEFFLKGPHA